MKNLYEIYLTCEQKRCNDLTIALAMFHADHPGLISHEEDREIREFIGRHTQALADAFKAHDKVAFDAIVDALIVEDSQVL